MAPDAVGGPDGRRYQVCGCSKMGYSVACFIIDGNNIDTVVMARDTTYACVNILTAWSMFGNQRRIEQIAHMAIFACFYLASVVSMVFRGSAIPVAGVTCIIQVIRIVYSPMYAIIKRGEIYIRHIRR
jgi:hypothetical protein